MHNGQMTDDECHAFDSFEEALEAAIKAAPQAERDALAVALAAEKEACTDIHDNPRNALAQPFLLHSLMVTIGSAVKEKA